VKEHEVARRLMRHFGLKLCLVGDGKLLHVADVMDTEQGIDQFTICRAGPTRPTDL